MVPKTGISGRTLDESSSETAFSQQNLTASLKYFSIGDSLLQYTHFYMSCQYWSGLPIIFPHPINFLPWQPGFEDSK